FGIMDFGYRAGVVIRCEPPVRWVTVNFVTAGSAEFASEGRAPILVDPSSAAVNDYTRPIRMTVSESAAQSMVTISKARLESYLQNLIGRAPDQPLRFAPTIDMRREGARFAATLSMIRSHLASRPDAEIAPSLAAEYEHALISALVLGQPNNFTPLIFAPVTPPPARVTDRVVEYIDSATDVPFTVRELTDVAQVSERTLYAAFRRDLGVSPMAYLRKIRLTRAREALLTAQEDHTGVENTVTAVAYRFGFNHVGRFAAHYREEFGEFPSETRKSRVVAVPSLTDKSRSH
ncbi:MAG: AraC family transcriptional regulator, partial [Comamonadaceae bacterium]